ncbi:MAG: hypothetical protein J5843_04070 [Clostridia bacterium]|nr:hypothetical protein [Clostridia bacterium]
MDEERKWNENGADEDDRTILSEQDLNDLDAVELDLVDEEAQAREKALKKKILIAAGAALFVASVTITVLLLTRKKGND